MVLKKEDVNTMEPGVDESLFVKLLNALYQPMAYSWDVTRTPQRCHLAQNVGSLVRKELRRSVQQSGNVQRMEPGVVWTSSVQSAGLYCDGVHDTISWHLKAFDPGREDTESL